MRKEDLGFLHVCFSWSMEWGNNLQNTIPSLWSMEISAEQTQMIHLLCERSPQGMLFFIKSFPVLN